MGKDDGLPLQMVGKSKEYANLVGCTIKTFLISEHEGNSVLLEVQFLDGRQVAVFINGKLDIDSYKIVPTLDINWQNI